MAKTRITKEYQNYIKRFEYQQKRHNLKHGARRFTIKQFKNSRKSGLTTTEILKPSMIIQTKTQEREVWRDYMRARKHYSRGETYEIEGGYEGLSMSSKGGISQAEAENRSDLLKYHYNLSGLLQDGHALHALITFQIDLGQDRKEVLADYGY